MRQCSELKPDLNVVNEFKKFLDVLFPILFNRIHKLAVTEPELFKLPTWDEYIATVEPKKRCKYTEGYNSYVNHE